MLSATLALLAAAAATSAANEVDAAPIENITVEAAKLPATTHELTSRVTLIDDARINKELAQNIDDLVRYEPGVDVVDQGSRFGMSGFNIRGIGGNRVRIEVDGVSTSDAFSIGSFSNASRDFIDVASLKQVEIIRGPSSALFGSDALGGVVSFVTKGPRDVLGNDSSYFDLSAGFNSVDTSGLLSGTAAFEVGSVASLFRVNLRQGEERDNGYADPLDEESVNLLARFDFGDAGDGAPSLTLEHFSAEGLTDVDSLEGVQDFSAAFGFPYVIDTSEVAGDDQRERSRVSFGQEWLTGKFGTDYLRWRAYYQDSNTTQDTFEARDTLIFGQPGAVERNRSFEFDQQLYGVEINLANEFETGWIEHQLAYGIQFEQADTEQIREGTETDLQTGESSSQVGPDLFPVRDFPKSETQSFGVYLQDRLTLGSVSITPGLRWDSYRLTPDPDPIFTAANPGIEAVEYDDDQISPKLGIAWQISDAWQLYGQYAEGFRAPPVNDVNVGFTNLAFGYTTLPNPDLKAEQSRGVETGVRYESDTMSWDLAGYVTRYDDFIESFQVVGFDPINQILQFQSVNIDEVEIFGAEISGSFAPGFLPEGWQFSLSAAYAEGENRATGVPVNSIAPLNGVFGIEYNTSTDSWGGTFLTRAAAGKKDVDNTDGDVLLPAGHAVFDLIGYWKPTDRTRLRAGIFNLTDHAYTAYLDVQGVPADTPNPERYQRPGREFNVAFDWIF